MINGIYWSVGMRDVNEDSVAFEDVHTEKGNVTLIAVCDGIGSLDHGEVVSGYVAECLVRWFYAEGIHVGSRPRSYIRKSICRCLFDCYTDVSMTAGGCGIRWGSTCTCAVIWGGRYMCVHMGSSSASLVTPGKDLTRITGAHVSKKGELIRGIVSSSYHVPDVSFGHIRPGQGMLVASNGFTDRFCEKELNAYLQLGGTVTEERINKRLAVIGAEAAKRGGSDDRSAVYAIRNRR